MYNLLSKLLENSYAPYSNFRVAAVLVMNDGKEYFGVNVENPSFRDGMCAEQVAIASAFADGYKVGEFNKLYIMGETKDIITPCFLCRQLISEVFSKESLIISMTKEEKVQEFRVEDLCPYTFGNNDLSGDKYEG